MEDTAVPSNTYATPVSNNQARSNDTLSRTDKQRTTTMLFMTIVKSAESAYAPPQELMNAIEQLRDEAVKAGVFLDTGGLLPSALGANVRLTNGKLTVTDGPFTEAKEVIGGFAVFNVKSKQEAIEWTLKFMELHKKHWPGWDGVTEVRQMWSPQDSPCT
jgi:hypothetical protein